MNLPPTCMYGHTAGWYVSGLTRVCRECRRLNNRKRRARERAETLTPGNGVHCAHPDHVFKKTVDPDAFFAKIESYRKRI